jgi:signal transduction protein with GAF and PtsI domain
VPKAREILAALQRTEQQLQILQRISRLMVKDVPLQDVFQEILALIREFMEADSCRLYLLDGDELALYACDGAGDEQVGKFRLKLGEGLAGWVARETRLLAITSEAYADPRFHGFPGLVEHAFEAFLAAPVINRNGIAGVITVQHGRAHQHSGSELEMMAAVGELAGCAYALAQPDTGALENTRDLILAPPAAGRN